MTTVFFKGLLNLHVEEEKNCSETKKPGSDN